MLYSSAPAGIRTSLFVSSHGKETLGPGVVSTPVSATLTTDLGYIVRIVLPTSTVVRRLFWANGATASTNTVQVGIYNDDLTTFLLGTATLSAGANALQFDNVTDTAISAGRYWMAVVLNGATATLFRTSNTTNHGGIYQMSAARPLPATLVPAAAGSAAVMPIFGFTSVA
jgi:hypothetical protein